jgi:hypothetical protein
MPHDNGAAVNESIHWHARQQDEQHHPEAEWWCGHLRMGHQSDQIN